MTLHSLYVGPEQGVHGFHALSESGFAELVRKADPDTDESSNSSDSDTADVATQCVDTMSLEHRSPREPKFLYASPEVFKSKEAWKRVAHSIDGNMLKQKRGNGYINMPTELSAMLIASTSYRLDDIKPELDHLLKVTASQNTVFKKTISRLTKDLHNLDDQKQREWMFGKLRYLLKSLSPDDRFHAYRNLAKVALTCDELPASVIFMQTESLLFRLAESCVDELRDIYSKKTKRTRQ